METNSSDDDEEEEYLPPVAPRMSHRQSGSRTGAESSRTAYEPEPEEFDVDEIDVHGGIDYGVLRMQAPTNLRWRNRVSYKGKTELVRELRIKNPRGSKGSIRLQILYMVPTRLL